MKGTARIGLLASLMALGSTLIPAPAMAAKAPAGLPLSTLRNEAEAFVRQAANHRHWALDSLTLTEESQTQSGSTLEAIYKVTMTHRLDYAAPEDVPVLKGKLDFMHANQAAMAATVRSRAQQEIDFWRAELSDYIKNPQLATDRVKVTASLNADGSVNPGSVKVLQEGAFSGFIPAEQVMKNIPAPATVAAEAKATMGKMFGPGSTEPIGTMAVYDRIAARAYANAWVKTTTSTCSDGTTLQDTANYNPNYNSYACNDCANFVSQSLKAGGIPTDTTWKAASYAWINVAGLKDYMVNTKGHWASGDRTNTVAGHVILLGTYHTMLVVYNDGTTFKFSAHSSDRLQRAFSGQSDATYWRVVY